MGSGFENDSLILSICPNVISFSKDIDLSLYLSLSVLFLNFCSYKEVGDLGGLQTCRFDFSTKVTFCVASLSNNHIPKFYIIQGLTFTVTYFTWKQTKNKKFYIFQLINNFVEINFLYSISKKIINNK